MSRSKINFNSKREKLIELFNSTLHDGKSSKELKFLISKYNDSSSSLREMFINYNLDILSFGNEIYKKKEMKMVLHLHNCINGSWHQDRQKTLIELIDYLKPKTIADIGFGVPSRYVKNIIEQHADICLTLADRDNDAIEFVKILMSYWDTDWIKNIKLVYYDIDSNIYIGDYDLYIFQDSIEHTLDPTAYLKLIVDHSPAESRFILSLPIAPLLPMHSISWNTKEDAKAWLKAAGLTINKEKQVYINPHIDLFADNMPDFSDLYVLCSKLPFRIPN